MASKIEYFLVMWLVVLCSDLGLAFGSHNPEDLPGWLGELQRISNTGKKLRGEEKIVIDPRKVTQLSHKPRAFLYEGFLSHEECDHLVNLGKNRVKRSTVVGKLGENGVLSDVRTSSGTFVPRRLDPIVKRIEQRISAWTFLPEEYGEDIQILRYNFGEKYGAHLDSFINPNDTESGGYRLATVLMYLSDVEKGGETVFPNAIHNQMKDDSWSECGKKGLGVKPVKGNALLFFSLHLNGEMDEHSLHTGCPVVEGIKWSATKWIHEDKFHISAFRDPSICIDEHPQCAEWAAMGECTRNPVYMVRSDLFPGHCRKSCNACETVQAEIQQALLST